MEDISATVGMSIGLILIIIAWILQLIYSWNGKREIRKRTLIFYNLGVAIIVLNSFFFLKVIDMIAVLNLIALIMGSLLLIKIGKSELKEEKTKRTIKRKKR